MSPKTNIRCVADVHAVLGEGPIWVARESALYWVDIHGRKIFRLNADGSHDEWPTPFRVGSLTPRTSGGFIAGTDVGLAEIDLAACRFSVLYDPEERLPENRFNDAKVDRHGRLWAGTMDDREQDARGTLYRFGADLQAIVVDQGYKVTNGPAFSPDGRRMYHNDSARQVTYAFDVDLEGNATNRSEFARYGNADGYPDGMTVDAQGCLWIAFWDGWCVRRFSPAGEQLQQIDLPVSRPTSCAFGGPRLDQLFITSASVGLDDSERARQPQAGGLFIADPGVQGLAELPFAG